MYSLHVLLPTCVSAGDGGGRPVGECTLIPLLDCDSVRMSDLEDLSPLLADRSNAFDLP